MDRKTSRIDPGETVIDAVNRELHEEMCVDQTQVFVTKADFLFATEHNKKDEKFQKTLYKLKLFFFVKEIDEITFNKIEESSRNAQHFGTENLGTVRAPLHYWRENDGFPRFLTNVFAGTSLGEFLMALYKTKIMNDNFT